MTERDAISPAARRGCVWRVVELNGRSLPVTPDFRPNRIDATVDRGVVTAVYVG
jgi:hypothetical protein